MSFARPQFEGRGTGRPKRRDRTQSAELRPWGPLLRVEAEAPRADIHALLHAFPTSKVALWLPPRGPSLLALGETARLVSRGVGRFASVADQAAQLLDRLPTLPDHAQQPQLLGGFSFAPLQREGTEWGPLGDALFRLPRWSLRSVGDRTTLLGICHRNSGEGDRLQAELGALLQLHAELASSQPGSIEGGTAAAAPAYAPDPDGGERRAWCQRTAALVEAIHRGDLLKAVHARHVQRPKPPHLGLAQALSALRPHGATATLFAIRDGSCSFLGASPERLIGKEGLRIGTEALAGTAPSEAGGRLIGSEKDRWEQRVVVDSILEGLRPWCEELEAPALPVARRLQNLTHLVTPISGQLTAERHVLELVERLHPTPAVGGLPKAAALQWIQRNEAESRGWYAAPFGWFDAQGDGEFLVALRSILLTPGEAHLFAGAGIVAGSEPDREWEECGWKLATAAGALHNGGGAS